MLNFFENAIDMYGRSMYKSSSSNQRCLTSLNKTN